VIGESNQTVGSGPELETGGEGFQNPDIKKIMKAVSR